MKRITSHAITTLNTCADSGFGTTQVITLQIHLARHPGDLTTEGEKRRYNADKAIVMRDFERILDATAGFRRPEPTVSAADICEGIHNSLTAVLRGTKG